MSDLYPNGIAQQADAGRKASNLAFALFALPPERKRDALIFYRFCRVLDDIADSPLLDQETRAKALNSWTTALTENSPPLPDDLVGIIARYGLDRRLLLEIVAGVQSDLTPIRYRTAEETEKYCWRVASAVGLASIRIFGCQRPESERYAESLGLALQWTNILRDVGDDAGSGRIYLPLDDCERFGVTADDLLSRRATSGFTELMKFEADRARRHFSDAKAARHPADHRALIAAEIMRALYSRLLDRIEADNFGVLTRRYRLARGEKIWLAARTLIARS